MHPTSTGDTIAFYRQALQAFHVWRPSAPRLPEPTGVVTEVASPIPPDFSVPGGRDPGEGIDPGSVGS